MELIFIFLTQNCYGCSHKIARLLSSLVEHHILICSGVMSTRYIHYLHVRPWIVKSYSVNHSERRSVPPSNVIAMEVDETEGSEVHDDNVQEKKMETREEIYSDNIHEHMEEIMQSLPKEATKFGRHIIKKGSQNIPV